MVECRSQKKTQKKNKKIKIRNKVKKTFKKGIEDWENFEKELKESYKTNKLKKRLKG